MHHEIANLNDPTLNNSIVFLIDDNKPLLETLSRAIERHQYEVRAYSSAREFLAEFKNERGCLLLDLSMPDMDGLELQTELAKQNLEIPIVFMTGCGEVSDSVKALRGGAIDFLQKPVPTKTLLQSIDEAIMLDTKYRVAESKKSEIRARLAKLTAREQDVFELLLEGTEPPSSKVIARALDISHRTVEHHRSRILEKVGVSTVVELRLTVGNTELTQSSRYAHA